MTPTTDDYTSDLIDNLVKIAIHQAEQVALVRNTQNHLLYAIFIVVVTGIWQRVASLPTPILIAVAAIVTAFVITDWVIYRISSALDAEFSVQHAIDAAHELP